MRRSLLLALLMLVFSTIAFSQQIPFQGKLLEDGIPFTGTKDFTFSIDIDGNVWTETHTGVSIQDGLYSLVLGSITPLPNNVFSGVDSRSLGISVDGNALSPVDIFSPFVTTNFSKDITGKTDSVGIKSTLSGIQDNSNASFYQVAVQGTSETDGFNVGINGEALGDNTNWNIGVRGAAGGDGTAIPYGVRAEVFGNNSGYSVAGIGYNQVTPPDNATMIGLYGRTFFGGVDTYSVGVQGRAQGQGGINIGVKGEAENGDENYAGWFEGDVVVNGNLSTFSNAIGFGAKDSNWDPGENAGFVHLYGDTPVDTDAVRASLESSNDGNGNSWGSLSLAGPVFNDPNCPSCVRSFVNLHVDNDPNNNDPNGWSGTLNLEGMNSPNIRMGGQSYENNDLPQLSLFGNTPDGGGWFYSHADIRVNRDGSQDFGELSLSGNEGDQNIQMGAKSWEDPNVGAQRPYFQMQGSINDDNLVWMDVFDDGNGNEAAGITFRSTDGSEFGMNAYGLSGGGQFNLSTEAYNLGEKDFENGNQGWLQLNGDSDGNKETARVQLEVDGEGNANQSGRLSLIGPVYNDPNCPDCAKRFVTLNVNNDPDNNDPNGWSGNMSLEGMTSPNIYMGGQAFEDNDLPQITLYGSLDDGNGWWYTHGDFRVIKDGNQEFGEFSISGNNGDQNIQMGAKSWEDPNVGAMRPYMSFTGSINDDQLIWMDVADAFGDGSVEAGSIDLQGTNGARTTVNAFGINGNEGDHNFAIDKTGASFGAGNNRGIQMGPDAGDGVGNESFLPFFFMFGDDGGFAPIDFRIGDAGSGDYGRMIIGGPNSNGVFISAENGGYISVDGNIDATNDLNISGNIRGNINDDEVFLGTDDLVGENYGKLSLFSAGGSNENIRLQGDVGSGSFSGDLSANRVFNSGGEITTSDARLKRDVATLDNALSNTLKLRGVSYNWIGPNKSTDKQIGVIAQEVEAVFPEFVEERPDGYKGVNYSQMVAVLIESIKELNAKIEALESENTELKAEVSKYESLQNQVNQLQNMMQSLMNSEQKTDDFQVTGQDQ